MRTSADVRRIAEAYLDATGRGDVDAVRAAFAPECEVWHNFDDAVVTGERSGRMLAWLHRTVPDLRWEPVALLVTERGWVSQSLMTGTAPGGPLRAHTCVVTTLDDDGRITRIEEYLDPAQLAVLRT